jgi:hypothetical protein
MAAWPWLQQAVEQPREQLLHVAHQRVVIDPEPVPFDHGELGVVHATAFALAEHARNLVDVRRAGA